MKKILTKKDIEARHISRRQFLIGTGGTLLLPPLMSLFPKNVYAANPVRRVILVPARWGINASHFYPTLNAGVNQVAGAVDVWTTPLSSILPATTNISRTLGSEFNDANLRSKMNFYRGLDFAQGGDTAHHSGCLSGCAAQDNSAEDKPFTPRYGTTIDNIIGVSPGVYSSTPQMRVLRIGSGIDAYKHSFTRSASGVIQYQNFYQGDRQTYNAVFQNLGNGGTNTLSPTDLDKISVADRFLTDATALKNNQRLSNGDKTLLDQFMTGLAELKQKINANTNPAICQQKPTMNLQVSASTAGNNGYSYPATYGITSCGAMVDNCNEIIRNAFLCDITRAVVFENVLYKDAPTSYQAQEFHNHIPNSCADKHAWFLTKIAKLAKSLDATSDPLNPGTTLLDNTVILFTNEHSGVEQHDVYSIPTLTIGSAGGTLNTGLLFDCRQRPFTSANQNYDRGRPLKQLLISIMQAVGVTPAEYLNKGDGKGFAEFDVYGSGWYSKFTSNHNDPLPGLKKV